MRFDIAAIVVSALATAVTAAPNALAAPNAVAARDQQLCKSIDIPFSFEEQLANSFSYVAASDMADVITYAANADCNIIDCVAVLAAFGCIGAGILSGDPALVVGCVIGGSQAVCYHFRIIYFLS
jgi:hypothetical protein